MQNGHLIAVFCALLTLSACSLQDDVNPELIDTSQQLQEAHFEPGTLEDLFLKDAERCALGDISVSDSLIERYRQSFLDQQSPDFLIYQQYDLTHHFERCAFKAQQLGNPEVFEAMIVNPVQCAVVSRSFYEKANYTDGAYWLQRLLNIEGLKNGYATAGNVFIRKPKTLAMGARLLQEAARLGHSDAHDTLLALLNPSSRIYQDVMESLREEFIARMRAQHGGMLPPPPPPPPPGQAPMKPKEEPL